jgi:probable addiction module antidote protein
MTKVVENITEFDLSSYLDSDEAIAEYLTEVLNDGDTNEFLRAISHIAKAKGMSDIARKTGLSRTSLYKVFSDDSKPRFETVMKLLKAFGVRLEAVV